MFAHIYKNVCPVFFVMGPIIGSDQDSSRVETVFKNKFTIIQTSQQMNRHCIRKIEA